MFGYIVSEVRRPPGLPWYLTIGQSAVAVSSLNSEFSRASSAWLLPLLSSTRPVCSWNARNSCRGEDGYKL